MSTQPIHPRPAVCARKLTVDAEPHGLVASAPKPERPADSAQKGRAPKLFGWVWKIFVIRPARIVCKILLPFFGREA